MARWETGEGQAGKRWLLPFSFFLRAPARATHSNPFAFSAPISSGTSFTTTPFWRLGGGA